MANRKRAKTQWYRVDLHLHTPASADYLDPSAGYIDLLRKADEHGLDIIAFTDHNTVAGYGAMLQEVERLEWLQQAGRATADELRLLAEYRRLLDKILVLPGFEFTATFGFHVLGIFPEDTPIRKLEHLLLSLNIPLHVLSEGNSEVGASADVLTVYRTIAEAGGICIAAHVNSAHGVAMTGLDFGGQTRIAYTQDRYLHALEVTDLGKRDRKSSQKFFDGTKPEYPRRMRCIQGSDAHALTTRRDEKANRIITLGIGERVTEVALAERSFEALSEMFQSSDFSRSRAYNPTRQPEDYIQLARDEGASIIQSFHEIFERKGARLNSIIEDVCAFANTNGGTVYVGVSTDKKKKIAGVEMPREVVDILRREISQTITPELQVEIDTQDTQGKTVIRVHVPYGEDRPYAIGGSKIYVRDETETTQAVRDEIVNLVRQGLVFQQSGSSNHLNSLNNLPLTSRADYPAVEAKLLPEPAPPLEIAHQSTTTLTIAPPRAGVEILDTEMRDGTRYYTMHDLRNGNIVRNVTLSSARRLWHYAIKQCEATPLKPEQIKWAAETGEIGLWRRYKKGGDIRYDLVQRDGTQIRVYYGVTENGMHDDWQKFLDTES